MLIKTSLAQPESEAEHHAAGQKGSDVSAKEATRKIVSASRQLQALQALLTAVGAPVLSGKEDSPQRGGPKSARASWVPRNTVVRDALNEIGNQARQR